MPRHGFPTDPKLSLQHTTHAQHPRQPTALSLLPPRPCPARIPVEYLAHPVAHVLSRHPPLIVEPLRATIPEGAVVNEREEAHVRWGQGIVKPDGYNPRGEKEEECVDQCLVFADEKPEGEVVVMVSVKHMLPPVDRFRRATKE